MGTYGKLRFDGHSKAYFLDLWQDGERHRLYRLPIMGGDLVLCKTKEMAKALQYVVSRQIDQGIFRAERFKQKKPLHLKAYAESWLKKQTHLMAATYRDYESYLRRYINPALGDIFIDDITTGMLGDFMKALPVAPKTKKNILGCIMKILRDAKIAGDITELPEKPIQRGKDKVIDPEVIWIEPEAQNAILDQLREIHRPLFMFLMLSGCRPSEARALRWVDIHAERSEIIVAKTFDYKGNLVPVKGKKILPIPMTEGLHYLFENITRNLSPYVFANPLTGRPYRRDALDKIWRKACKKALGDVVPLYSSTRHSYASQLVNAGVDVAIVQRLLRHTDVRITKRYYEYKTSPLRISVENVRSIFDVRKTVSKPSVNSNDDGKEVIN